MATPYAPAGMNPACPPMPGCPPYQGAPMAWPKDEYLIDGGDRGQQAGVRSDWRVEGLELEDTIAHYDTLNGRVVVEPSNRVYIYSPRFASVRQVTGVAQDHVWTTTAGVDRPMPVLGLDEAQTVARRNETVQIEQKRDRYITNQMRTREGGDMLASLVSPTYFETSFKAYEDLQTIRVGGLHESEMARLAESTLRALEWTEEQAVQVCLNQQAVGVEALARGTATIYQVEDPPGEPKLQIVKVASTGEAQPGDIVEFTLRFDNTGAELLGNVTIIDNLTTRLEYVEDSAQCSVEANFMHEVNEGDSLALRWEIVDPLEPGQGGIIRFQCRVR